MIAGGERSWRVEQPAPVFEAFRDVVVDTEGRAVVAGGTYLTNVSPAGELSVFDTDGGVARPWTGIVRSKAGSAGLLARADEPEG